MNVLEGLNGVIGERMLEGRIEVVGKNGLEGMIYESRVWGRG